jgi:cytochrome P450
VTADSPFGEDALRDPLPLEERQAEPGRSGERMIARLLVARVDGRPLADLEIGSHLETLAIGGTQTTPKVVVTALLRLYEHPEQREAILAGDARAPHCEVEVARVVRRASDRTRGTAELPLRMGRA